VVRGKKRLGEKHPDTAKAMSNLAVTLYAQGRVDESAKMLKDVIEARKRIIGSQHPNTILAMANLVIVLKAQGQINEAAKMEKEVLEKRRHVLDE
jgi:Flp pilus assembly protein TadD